MAEGEHPNCQAIEDFLNEIPSVSRPIVKTQNINGVPAHEAYTASWHDPKHGDGFTAIAYGEDGGLLVITEGRFGGKNYKGSIANAKQFGRRINALIVGNA